MKVSDIPIIMMGGFIVILLVAKVWHPQPYNTEIVCFDENSEVVYYASGHSPNADKLPLIHLNGDTYRFRETGEKLKAKCQYSWGVNPPKGKEYYQ